MKFGIITDPHLGANSVFNGAVRIWGEKAPENLAYALTSLQSHSDLAFIAQLGDGIEESKSGDAAIDRSHFATLAKALSGVRCPVYHLIGNHDPVNISAQEVANLLGMPDTHYSFEAEGFTGVVLFCPSVDHINPTLERDQVQWLGDTLAAATSEVLLFAHHALAEHSLDHTFWFKGKPEKAFVKNRAEVLKILSGSKKVRAGFNGHLHASNFTRVAGIPFFTIQSLSQAIEPDLRAAQAHAVVEVKRDLVTVSILGNEPVIYSAPR